MRVMEVPQTLIEETYVEVHGAPRGGDVFGPESLKWHEASQFCSSGFRFGSGADFRQSARLVGPRCQKELMTHGP